MSGPTPADPLGYDMKVGADLDASGRSATGLELVEDGMLHRLSCGMLLQTGAPDDQVEFGEDVRTWVGEALSDADLTAKAPRLEEVLRRDPRIASATVSLRVAPADVASRYRFLIHVQAVTVRGQVIDRIVGVSQLTVEFLAQGR